MLAAKAQKLPTVTSCDVSDVDKCHAGYTWSVTLLIATVTGQDTHNRCQALNVVPFHGGDETLSKSPSALTSSDQPGDPSPAVSGKCVATSCGIFFNNRCLFLLLLG